MPSLFSRIIAGEIPGAFVYRSPRWVAFLDINPVAPGHILLVPVQEAGLIMQLDGPTLAEMGPIMAALDQGLRRVTQCDAVSILIRDGAAAGQEVPHVHIHLIPRRQGDAPHQFKGDRYSDGAMEFYRQALEQAMRT